jgi:hypothetical protein
LQSSGKTDTIQVLVGQSYIQMGDYSHKMYVPDSNKIKAIINSGPVAWRFDVLPGDYESRKYDPPLVVDKTKFTMGDAQHYLKASNITKPKIIKWDMVYQNEKFEESRRPYIGGQEFRFANERSKKEGLDTAYIMVDLRSYNLKNAKNHILLGDTNAADAGNIFLLIDTLASGYRLPYREEWFFLMRAGSSTRYYWGDEEDSLKVSRYAWVNPVGLKPVAKLLPNKFGLYDMVGMADETIMTHYSYAANGVYYNYHDFTSSFGGKCPECHFMRETRTAMEGMRIPPLARECTLRRNEMGEPEEKCVDIEPKPSLVAEKANFGSFRLLRKTPKLHKLEKF